jgi:hypothetical protein
VSNYRATQTGISIVKTVVIARAGNLSVADHIGEMRAWLKERNIEPRELTMLHVVDFRVVFRAVFDANHEADLFTQEFG